MKHPLKKMISLTLVAAFLLGLFPALDTPAGAKLAETAETTLSVVEGLTATSPSDDPGDWLVTAGGETATIAGALNGGSSTLTLKNTSGAAGKILSFTYTVEKGKVQINGKTVTGTDTYFQTLAANEPVTVALIGVSVVTLSSVGYRVHEHDGFSFATAWGNTYAERSSLPTAAGSYFLTHDVTLSATWRPANDVDLCLNGHMIRLDAGNFNNTQTGGIRSVIWMNKSGKTLNICDCDGSHGSHSVANRYAGSGTVTITGGVITGGLGYRRYTASNGYDTAGGGVYITQGNLGFYGGTIADNTAQYGAGIFAQGGSQSAAVQVTLGGSAHVSYNANTTYSGGSAKGHSAGVCVSNFAHLTVNNDAVISYNKAIEHSGGIGVEKGGSVTINGGTITGNHAPKGGGLALTHLTNASTVTINGGSITGNTAVTEGAGILMMGGEENFEDSLILSGATRVKENNLTGAEQRESNLVPNADAEITIGNLTGAEIGVDVQSEIKFANAGDTDTAAAGAAVFTSDRGGQTVALDGSQIQLLSGVKYTVEHYQQNIDGSYTAVKTEERVAPSGSAVTLTEADYQSCEGFTHVLTSGSRESGSVGTADNSLTLKVYYQRDAYQVSYEYKGDVPAGRNPPDAAGRRWGETVSAAAPSSQSGYRFSGWTTSDVSVENGSFTMPRQAVKFTGTWAKIYKISYDLAGGAVAQENPTSYVKADTFTLNNPTKTGYTFAGWTGGGHTEPDTTVTVSESSVNLSYTAHWTPVTYGLTYDLDGGALAEGQTNPADYTVETASFTLNNPTKAGYRFTGWTGTGLDGARTSVTISKGSTGDRAYTATWTPISYTISCTLNGGTVSGTNPTHYTVESEAITLINPTRSGYAFKGWSGTELTGDSNTNVTIATGSTGNRSYTAHWTKTTYTITYDLKGGTASPANPEGYDKETASFTLTNPTRDGYTFAGWSGTGLDGDSNTDVTIATGSEGNRAYTAHWTKNTYNISYDLDGGSESSANPTTYDVETNAFTLHNPTREHYTFAGWTGTGLDSAAQSVTVARGSTGNRTYTATWTPVTYGITYDLSGGTLAAGETNPTSYNIETAAFTLHNPTKAGCTFAGWTGTGLVSATKDVTIAQGSIGERGYTATWQAGYDLRFHRANGTTETIGRTAAPDEPVTQAAPSLTAGYHWWFSAARQEKFAAGDSITGIRESRDYQEVKYIVTFTDGDGVLVASDSDGGVFAPSLAPGRVWRSGGTYKEGGAAFTVSGDMTFIAVNKALISSASVDVTRPANGSAPNAVVTVNGGGTTFTASVIWKQDSRTLTGGDRFAAGATYTAVVTLTPAPGYQFTANPAITLNGKSVTPSPGTDGAVTAVLDFFLPTVERTAWTWARDYSSASVTVIYSTDTDLVPDREELTPAVTTSTVGNTATYRADAAATRYGSHTVSDELTVTRSGETVTGVTVKKWLNGAQTLNVVLTAGNGTITENGGGDFSVSGAAVIVVNGTTYTLHDNGSARLTANGALSIEKGSATVSGGDTPGGTGGTGGAGGGSGGGTGGAGGAGSGGTPGSTGGAGGGGTGGASGGASYSYVVEGPFTVYGEGVPFSDTLYEDVSPGDWYYDSVAFVAEQGWMTGVSENTFAPGDNSTRAMIVTVLHRMSGSAAPAAGSSYTDVMPGRYYAGAVAWAEENGITLGVSSSLFRPDEAVTREQFVTFLYRYALYRSMNTQGRDDLSRYADWETVSSYAENPMQWASDSGIIVGRSILLAPHEPATRAEIATMLARFCNIYGSAGLQI